MKISVILDFIDNGLLALPEFFRGYVWNREQVRGLFDSLYRRHPIGGLLVWATESQTASHRGDSPLATGVVKLLLDGQQRMTSLYGVVRGNPPKFFDGNSNSLTGLRFNLEEETFEFFQPVKMKDDPLWIDVTALMKKGATGLGEYATLMSANPILAPHMGEYVSRLSKLLSIVEVDLHIEEISGADKSLDVVVDIFNRVNSSGTKLSKGDLALAKICADWPQGREAMKVELEKWKQSGYNFNLDWLLRSVNTVLTGEAKFQYLHERNSDEVQDALTCATKHIDSCLNLISGFLGLDHDRVFFGRFAVPVMTRYLDQRQSQGKSSMDEKERDKLLFWYLQAAMWGRFSGSTESFIDQDLEALEGSDGGLDKLLEQLRLWNGGLRAEPGHFTGWSLGARFYPVLYFLTRVGKAKDWGTGLELKSGMLGPMSKLEVHHIFPKSKLYNYGYRKSQVNALANFCFLTKESNLHISNQFPQDYFPKVEADHPGALESQWIPMDPTLWELESFPDFLEARKELLAEELNTRMEVLLHGDLHWLEGKTATIAVDSESIGGITSEEEEREIESINSWIVSQGLPSGEITYDLSDEQTGMQKAVLDLAWPAGIQTELSQPVAVLINESSETHSVASLAGFRCFTSTHEFKHYVERDILANEAFR